MDHGIFVHSAYDSFALPSVLRLKRFIRFQSHQRLRLSRDNIYLRDGYACQYCAETFPVEHLTLDHVLPASRGGNNDWVNLVTACRKCNHHKGNRSPNEAKMPLIRSPYRPRWLPLTHHSFRLSQFPESWAPYLR